jgi:hypothetical protein
MIRESRRKGLTPLGKEAFWNYSIFASLLSPQLHPPFTVHRPLFVFVFLYFTSTLILAVSRLSVPFLSLRPPGSILMAGV